MSWQAQTLKCDNIIWCVPVGDDGNGIRWVLLFSLWNVGLILMMQSFGFGSPNSTVRHGRTEMHFEHTHTHTHRLSAPQADRHPVGKAQHKHWEMNRRSLRHLPGEKAPGKCASWTLNIQKGIWKWPSHMCKGGNVERHAYIEGNHQTDGLCNTMSQHLFTMPVCLEMTSKKAGNHFQCIKHQPLAYKKKKSNVMQRSTSVIHGSSWDCRYQDAL